MAKKKKNLKQLQYQALVKKIQRLKKEANDLTRLQPEGYRTERSKIYAELVIANKQLIKLSRELEVENRRRERVRRKKIVRDVPTKTKYYTVTVWVGEDLLRTWIKLKTYKTIYIENTAQVFNVNTTGASTILSAWDVALNEVYLQRNSTTPFVDIIEDLKNNTVSFDILS